MKPQPNSEMIIECVLHITTHSNDSYQWVKQEAPLFGAYHEPEEIGEQHILFISREWDPVEVLDYLRRMDTKVVGKEDI